MPEIGASHKITHQDGGNDELSVEGLGGDLADAQESTWTRVSGKPTTFDPTSHKTSHQDTGTDEISVAGLSGALADAQIPSAHKTSHQDTGTDEISVAGLAGQVVFVPYNGKIADINEDDTDKHFLNLATALNEARNILSVLIFYHRVSGTGIISVYANEGNAPLDLGWYSGPSEIIIKNGTNRLQYNQSVSNDNFDLYCIGYTVIGA